MIPAQVGFALRNTDADLVATANKSLAKLKADGTVPAIYAKYGIDFAVAQ
jgi:ABC-type amino acid transport substrate-binding protein